MLGGKISSYNEKCIIDPEDIRSIFIKKCIPLINLDFSDINIFDKNTNLFFKYDNDNILTYNLNNDFYLEQIQIDHSIIKKPFDIKNELTFFLEENINSYLNINNVKIPFLYFFTNNNEIFNLFLQNYGKKNKIYESIFKYIKHNPNYFFMFLSYKFNIFNISFYTNKFFDLINFVIELDNLYNHLFILDTKSNTINLNKKSENIIKLTINKYFNDLFINYKKGLINLYDINSYNLFKTKILLPLKINNDDDFKKYIINEIEKIENSKPLDINLTLDDIIELLKKYSNDKKDKNKSKYHTLFTYCDNFKKINNLEKDLIDDIEISEDNIEVNYIKIINTLSNDFYNLYYDLKLINVTYNIDNYHIIFLISILSYRLNNYPYHINETNLLCNGYVLDFLKKNKINEFISNTKEELNNLYNKPIPLIYNYSQSEYKQKFFSNCMENTILHFIKIILWNYNEKKYIIEESLFSNITLFNKIKDLFKIIYKEQSKEFINKWTSFIYDDIATNEIELDFIKKENDIQFELNATLNNLLIICKKLFKVDNSLPNKDYFNTLLKLNKSYLPSYLPSYNIEIYNNEYKDIISDIIIINIYSKFSINLVHKTHAFFNVINDLNITDEFMEIYKKQNKINIFEYTNDILNKNKFKYLSFFNEYIFYLLIFNNKKFINFKNYINYSLNENNLLDLIKNIFFHHDIKSYTLDFWGDFCKNDILLNICIQNTEIFIHILKSKKKWNNSKDLDNPYSQKTFFNDIINIIKVNNFINFLSSNNIWNHIIVNIQENLCIFDFIKYNDHINIIKEVWFNKNLTTTDTTWIYAIQYIKDKDFWINLINNNFDIIEKWDSLNNENNTIWHYAVEYIRIDEFWKILIEKHKDIINNHWFIKNNLNKSTYDFIMDDGLKQYNLYFINIDSLFSDEPLLTIYLDKEDSKSIKSDTSSEPNSNSNSDTDTDDDTKKKYIKYKIKYINLKYNF
jgi:hypothetical protein